MDAAVPRVPLVAAVGLGFAFHGRPPVLRAVDFTLDAGERVGLIGANGSGKTTFLHLLVGLLRRQRGTLTVFGTPRVVEDDFWEVRARCGLLFQDPDDQLFCPTVLEDVAFGPLNLGRSRAEAREIAHRTLARLGLAGFEDRVAHALSGGEKRLVTLAGVLAMAPDILLLDEPTNALDPIAAARLTEILRDLPQAMVIVSHDRSFLDALATRQVRLDRGVLDPA